MHVPTFENIPIVSSKLALLLHYDCNFNCMRNTLFVNKRFKNPVAFGGPLVFKFLTNTYFTQTL